jgi:hypothetical protein
MRACASVACILLILLIGAPAAAGGRGARPEHDTLRVLRGVLLEAGELDAPFADPGAPLGRFVLRSADHGDLRADPGMARLNVRGGALWARAADPSEDVGGLVELCRLGISPFPCATLPFRPAPEPPDAQGIYFPLVGLNQHLTSEQQALLGCGPFYGTECDGSLFLPGSDLLGGDPSAGSGRFGRRDFVWTPEDGEVVVIPPFIRDPGLPSGGIFSSELAAVSWNALMLLVAASHQEGEPSDDTFDPDDPFRTDGCSFATPQLCLGVGGFTDLGSWRLTELPGDPRGGDPERWLWDSAIAYDVVHARGSLAGLRDGRLYVYGPFESPVEGSASGVGLLLVPPPDASPELTSPMLRVVPGPDRALGTPDDLVAGFAWGAAWPGFDGVSKHSPKPRGRALGQGSRFKPGGGKPGAHGHRRGRP